MFNGFLSAPLQPRETSCHLQLVVVKHIFVNEIFLSSL